MSEPAGRSPRKGARWHGCAMLKGLWNLLLYRVLGGRFMLAVAVFSVLRRLFFGRKDTERGPSDGRLAGSASASRPASTRVRRGS